MKIYKTESVECEHCGERLGPGYQVVINDIYWCIFCAAANGDIDEKELEKLSDAEEEIRERINDLIKKKWLDK